jgi:hypothetical protein
MDTNPTPTPKDIGEILQQETDALQRYSDARREAMAAIERLVANNRADLYAIYPLSLSRSDDDMVTAIMGAIDDGIIHPLQDRGTA